MEWTLGSEQVLNDLISGLWDNSICTCQFWKLKKMCLLSILSSVIIANYYIAISFMFVIKSIWNLPCLLPIVKCWFQCQDFTHKILTCQQWHGNAAKAVQSRPCKFQIIIVYLEIDCMYVCVHSQYLYSRIKLSDWLCYL